VSKLLTVAAALGLLCAVATAQLSPSGINTYTEYNGEPAPECSVECWKSQPQDLYWTRHSAHNTDEQHWPPHYNRLRWAHSSQSDPKVVIDTGYYYTFKAKKYIGGQWRYSEWSVAVNYHSPTVYANRVLELSLTSDPGDPSNIAIED
jgi:hypothetical protein